MSQTSLRNPIQMGGVGKIVELDEACVGCKKKYNCGYHQGSGNKWILGILDVQTNNCHVQIVGYRERNTLYPIITTGLYGSQINSDEFTTYFTLNQIGYTHRTVKHA